MENFRVAVKSFIVKDSRLLMIKRRGNDMHSPGEWDIPGGKLEHGENPFEGLKREGMEELGIGIEIIMPFHVQHFTREDGQNITIIIFLCRPLQGQIRLSQEHTDFRWAPLDSNDGIPRWLAQVVEIFSRFKLGDFIG